MDFFNRLQPLAQFLMRIVLGAILAAHGYHRVWSGFPQHMQFAVWAAYLAAAVEFFGGIAIILGLFTRFFALAVVIEKAMAIWQVHPRNWLTCNEGVEFQLTLAAMAFALMCFGGGSWGFNFGKGGGRKTKPGS